MNLKQVQPFRTGRSIRNNNNRTNSENLSHFLFTYLFLTVSTLQTILNLSLITDISKQRKTIRHKETKNVWSKWSYTGLEKSFSTNKIRDYYKIPICMQTDQTTGNGSGMECVKQYKPESNLDQTSFFFDLDRNGYKVDQRKQKINLTENQK